MPSGSEIKRQACPAPTFGSEISSEGPQFEPVCKSESGSVSNCGNGTHGNSNSDDSLPLGV